MRTVQTPPVFILTGPTASGKTGFSLKLALLHGRIEIINGDSLLVYRGMDIGTAKPTLEERSSVPHHLIDVCDPDHKFTAGDFSREAESAISEIRSRGNVPLIVGGSGFYLKALVHGLWDAPKSEPLLRTRLESEPIEALFAQLESLDPTSAKKIGPRDRYRLVRACEILELTGKKPSELEKEALMRPKKQEFRIWAIDRARDELEERIGLRTRKMLADGLIGETLRIRSLFPQARALGSVGYAQVIAFVDGIQPEGRSVPSGTDGLLQEIELATRQLVAKQRKWLKSQTTREDWVLDRDEKRMIEAFFLVNPPQAK